MDSRRPPTAAPLVEQIAEHPSAGKRKYTSYRSLLMRSAAVWKQGSHVWFSTAGDSPQTHRLSCVNGQEANRLTMTFSTELRKARSDEEYNAIVLQVLKDIRSAWPDNVKVRHVHMCRAAIPTAGETIKFGETGVCYCGFDWGIHELSTGCPCVVEIDYSDDTGEWQFVVHRSGWKRKEMVSV